MENFYKYINEYYVLTLILVSYGLFTLFEKDYRFKFLLDNKAIITFVIGVILGAFFYYEIEQDFMKLLCSFGFATSFYQLFIKRLVDFLNAGGKDATS